MKINNGNEKLISVEPARKIFSEYLQVEINKDKCSFYLVDKDWEYVHLETLIFNRGCVPEISMSTLFILKYCFGFSDITLKKNGQYDTKIVLNKLKL